MSNKTYRPEIDGLRTIAVAPVVLFHAGYSIFHGGFVGVDVFFVISGYLITQILVGQASVGRLSIRSFYERRVRRIAPALLTVLIASFLAAHLLLFPAQYVGFAKSLLAVEVFGSNFWFWSQTGYFTAQGGITPLLHTWSLAVEEQFYVFIPIVIALLARWPHWMKALLIVSAVASLAMSAAGVFLFPSVTFYMLPTRAFELLIGSLLAIGVAPSVKSIAAAQAGAAIGLAIIIGAVFLIDETMRFPGPLALVPCLGTAMVLHYTNGRGTFVGALLSTKPMVAIGLVSYSLYLWHWPVIAFMRQYIGGPLDRGAAVTAVALSAALAVATYLFVETPTRSRWSLRKLFMVCGLAGAAIAVAALAVILGVGMPGRFSPTAQRYADGTNDRSLIATRCRADNKACALGAAGSDTFVLIGDSHAGALAEAVDIAARSVNVRGRLMQLDACPPLTGWKAPGPIRDSTACDQRNGASFSAALSDPAIRTVMLTGNWPSYLVTDSKTAEAALARTIDRVRSANKIVIVFSGLPHPDIDLPWTMALAEVHGRPQPEIARPTPVFAEIQRRYQRDPNVRFVSLADAMCGARSCTTQVAGHPSFSDGNHISRTSSVRLIGPYLKGRGLFR